MVNRRQCIHGLLAAGLGPAHAAEPDALQIARLSAAVDRVPAWSAQVGVSDLQGTELRRQRQGRLRNLAAANGRDFLRHYAFTAPDDIRGTVLLIHEHAGADDDLWLFLPALGKPRRVAGSGRRNSFVGTQYAFFDLMGFDPDRYRHSLAGKAEVDGRACWMLDSEPLDPRYAQDIGRSRLRAWIDLENHRTLRVDHHDLGGVVFKRHELREHVSVPGSTLALATRRRMTHLGTGAATVIELTQLDLQPRLGPGDFAPGQIGA